MHFYLSLQPCVRGFNCHNLLIPLSECSILGVKLRSLLHKPPFQLQPEKRLINDLYMHILL